MSALRLNKGYLTVSLIWIILIFVGCTMHSNTAPKLHLIPHADKFVHAGIYIVLAYLLLKAFNGAFAIPLVLFAICYGLFIEWYQGHYTSDRSMDFWDAIANTAGVLIGWRTYCLIRK